MRSLATALLVLAGLTAATAAFAVDFGQKSAVPQGLDLQFTLTAVMACDNNAPGSAWYQIDAARYGNLFNLGGGMRLSHVEFAHDGFGFSGPYAYDVEIWDPTSCTMVTALNGLTAQDAADHIAVESVDLCPMGLILGGDVIVAIDANTCLNPEDCYPDVVFDTQLNVLCPYHIDVRNPAAVVCEDVSAQAGPFILRLELDNCPVPAIPLTWGTVKGHYR